MNKKYKLYSDKIPLEVLYKLESIAGSVKYRPCPYWLGNFNFKVFNEKSLPEQEHLIVFDEALALAVSIADIKQDFNTIFIQKYEIGELVRPHKDPRSNVGYTIVIPFGEFKGATNTIEEDELIIEPGDFLVQECTNGFSMGPKHSVSAVQSGTRYALIFNTIVGG
jgi:hypothetical protein